MNEKDASVARLHQLVFVQNPSAWRPMLLAHGYPEVSVDRWIAGTQDELGNLTKRYRVEVSHLNDVRSLNQTLAVVRNLGNQGRRSVYVTLKRVIVHRTCALV